MWNVERLLSSPLVLLTIIGMPAENRLTTATFRDAWCSDWAKPLVPVLTVGSRSQIKAGYEKVDLVGGQTSEREGMRKRKATLLDEGFVADIPARRFKCPVCGLSWTRAPEGVPSRAHYQPCVVSHALERMAAEPETTAAEIAEAAGCLEDVRLLSIADFDRKSPFGLVLSGHPSLDERLAEPIHHALDQRITTVARLAPLSLDETREYVRLRLDAAGAKGQPIFEDDAIASLFESSTGVPRRLNRIASAAMIVAASRRKNVVVAQDVHDARVDRGRA